MPLHFSLDFTAPFQVDDQVYTNYPPGDEETLGGPIPHGYIKGKIAAVKLMLDLNPGNSCTVTQPGSEQQLQVEKVVYTVMPLPPHNQSAFTVECSTEEGSHPKLFLNEADLESGK